MKKKKTIKSILKYFLEFDLENKTRQKDLGWGLVGKISTPPPSRIEYNLTTYIKPFHRVCLVTQ